MLTGVQMTIIYTCSWYDQKNWDTGYFGLNEALYKYEYKFNESNCIVMFAVILRPL